MYRFLIKAPQSSLTPNWGYRCRVAYDQIVGVSELHLAADRQRGVPGNGVGVGRGEGDAGVELGAVLQVVNGQPVRLLLIWVSVYERIR
jgi:hypothetical protein